MANIKTQFLPAPISGLNLIADPTNLQPTEARQLDNYYIYDWGIRERGAITEISPLPDGAIAIYMYAFTSVALNKQYVLISTSFGNTYLYDGSAFTAWNIGTAFWGASAFNNKIILPRSGSTSVDTFNINNGARVAAAFVVSGSSTAGSFVFKDRVYLLNYQSGMVDYGGPGLTAGGIVGSYDLGQIFQRGQTAIWGTAWSYNQGQINDQLFVVGNEAGEVLIYSGSYPAHANWQLVTRAQIPAPYLQAANTPGQVKVINLGQDILINTVRGVISLANVVAGKNDLTGYYAVSKNLGNVLSGALIDCSDQVPFAYFCSDRDLYILNYERGAWSKFPNIAPGGGRIYGIACQTVPVGISTGTGASSYVLIATTSQHLYKISESATAGDSTATYTWTTPYFNFSYPRLKSIGNINVLSRDMASSLVTNSVGAYSDFDETSAGTVHTPTTTVSSTGYVRQLVQPATNPAVWSSLKFSKTGSASALNEIAGFDISYEELGSTR